MPHARQAQEAEGKRKTGQRAERGGHEGLTTETGSPNLDLFASHLSAPFVLQLQRTVGNQAVGQFLSRVARSQARTTDVGNPSTVQRGGVPDPETRTDQSLPNQPSIAAKMSGQGHGNHASIFLAVSFAGNQSLKYFKIDLTGSAQVPINILIQNATSWASTGQSTTWTITNDQARAALDKATEFQQNKADYTYDKYAIGWRKYNCALFAEKILKAAGINQSAGLIVSTPYELVHGKKFPD